MYTLQVSSNRYTFSVSLRGALAGANPLARRFFCSVAAGAAPAAASEPADFKKLRRVSRGMTNLLKMPAEQTANSCPGSGCRQPPLDAIVRQTLLVREYPEGFFQVK